VNLEEIKNLDEVPAGGMIGFERDWYLVLDRDEANQAAGNTTVASLQTGARRTLSNDEVVCHFPRGGFNIGRSDRYA